MTFRRFSEKIMKGEYLSREELKTLVYDMRNGNLDDLEFIVILTAMQTRNEIKGFSIRESYDFIESLRPFPIRNVEGTLCNSGTGGDKIKTVNISTLSSIVMASSGIKVLKNGSKGTTGSRGAKEALENLGIQTQEDIDEVIKSVEKTGIGYYDFSKMVPIRGRAGLVTPLNMLGPLCSPVRLSFKLLGCTDIKYVEIAESLLKRLTDNYLITNNPSIDELSLEEPTTIVERRFGISRKYVFDPRQEGLPKIGYEEISPVEDNDRDAKLALETLGGKKGPVRDIICLNSGAGIYLVGKADSITEGYYKAQNILDSGEPLKKLREWREFQKNGQKSDI